MKRWYVIVSWAAAMILVTVPLLVEAKPSFGDLVSAVKGRDVATLKRLLAEKGNPNATDSDGYPLLLFAAAGGSIDVVKLLLDSGANPNLTCKKTGASALFLASDRGYAEVAKLLIEKGANLNHRSRKGFTPLAVAASGGHEGVVDVLLRQGADVNIVTNDGQSPLLTASASGYAGIVRLLLEHKADVNARDEKTNAPLHFAVGGQYADVVSLLLAHGADINARGYAGMTPLMVAADREDPEMISLLLKAGADMSARNTRGLSAADISRLALTVQSMVSAPSDYQRAGEAVRLTEWTVAARNVKAHRDLTSAAFMVGAKEESPEYFSDLSRSLAAEGIIKKLPEGTFVLPTGKANALIAQVFVRGQPGIWWIPVHALTKAGLPAPPVDYNYVRDEEDAGR